jgi:hypothetical protein
LFATSAPFQPVFTPLGFVGIVIPPLLELEGLDMPIGQPQKTVLGYLQLPLQPSFAEEAE